MSNIVICMFVLFSKFLYATVVNPDTMKYILLFASIILIIYPIYGLMRNTQIIVGLSNYVMGLSVGGLLILIGGIVMLCVSIKMFIKQKV